LSIRFSGAPLKPSEILTFGLGPAKCWS
jgi:hypothetical protein